jgi:hypothetical protein
VSSIFRKRRWLTLTLAIGAALGALGFQLALATGPAKSPKEPELAYLIAPKARASYGMGWIWAPVSSTRKSPC